MQKVVIPDPGLREFGGHHPAMIDSLASSIKVIEGNISLDVYCNNDIGAEALNQIETKNVSLIKHFETDFYLHFYQDFSLVKMNPYIVMLTHEYLVLFNHYVGYNKNEILFLYHTLHWEHAFALASAINIFKNKSNVVFRHCIFLMFNPEQYNQQQQLGVTRFLNFKVAFGLLNKYEDVTCYAGEYELQTAYQKLLNTQVDIHPCGLLSRKEIIPRAIKKQSDKCTVILFTGDVKANKGFLQLPELIRQITKNIKLKDITFLIQYTLTSENQDLADVDVEIKKLVKLDKRILLVDRFWTHKELHQNFDSASIILFNYDEKIYKNQSSGVLWLAALHNLKMIFMTDSWLNREAKRLNCDYKMCKEYDVFRAIKDYAVEKSSSSEHLQGTINKTQHVNDISEKSYRDLLFQDTSDWLYNKYSAIN